MKSLNSVNFTFDFFRLVNVSNSFVWFVEISQVQASPLSAAARSRSAPSAECNVCVPW